MELLLFIVTNEATKVNVGYIPVFDYVFGNMGNLAGTWLGVELEFVPGDPSTCNCLCVFCLYRVEEN